MKSYLKITLIFGIVAFAIFYIVYHYSASNKIVYQMESLKQQVSVRLVDSSKKCISFNGGKRRYFANDDFSDQDNFQVKYYLKDSIKCYVEIFRNDHSIIKTKSDTCMDFNVIPKMVLGYKPNKEVILIDDQCY